MQLKPLERPSRDAAFPHLTLGGETEGDIVNSESVPGETDSLSVPSYSSHSMMAVHYVPLRPRP